MFLKTKNILDKVAENQNTHFMFNNFLKKKRAVYEIMLKNTVQPDRRGNLKKLQLRSLHSVDNIRMKIIWGICGMILTGETEVPEEKTFPVSLCAPQIQHELDCDRIRDS
jgi:hypothetical protein